MEFWSQINSRFPPRKLKVNRCQIAGIADGRDLEPERRQTRGLNKYLPNSHVSAVVIAVPRPPQSRAPASGSQQKSFILRVLGVREAFLCSTWRGEIPEVKIDGKSVHYFSLKRNVNENRNRMPETRFGEIV